MTQEEAAVYHPIKDESQKKHLYRFKMPRSNQTSIFTLSAFCQASIRYFSLHVMQYFPYICL